MPLEKFKINPTVARWLRCHIEWRALVLARKYLCYCQIDAQKKATAARNDKLFKSIPKTAQNEVEELLKVLNGDFS